MTTLDIIQMAVGLVLFIVGYEIGAHEERKTQREHIKLLKDLHCRTANTLTDVCAYLHGVGATHKTSEIVRARAAAKVGQMRILDFNSKHRDWMN